MNFLRNITSLCFFLLCCTGLLTAGNETVNSRIAGSQIQDNAQVFVQDNNYPNVELGGAAKVASASGIVIFSIDNASNLYYNTSSTVKVGLLIKSYDKNGNLQSTPFPVDLEIGYSPTGSYKDKSVYVVNGSHSISATIQYIKDGSGAFILPGDIPQNMALEVEQTSERYYQFTTTIAPTMNSASLSASNELVIKWNTQAGAEEYELEWTYANSYPVSGTTPVADNLTDYSFKNNSTRVRVSQNSYPVSLIYDQGYLVYRVRAIGRSLSNTSSELVGKWSGSGLETSKVNLAGSNSYYPINTADRHEKDKNWQYSASYAEEGKKKEVVSYFDGSLRNRQSVTKLNTDNKAIIGETFYDHQGRGAVQVLPTPTSDAEIKYYPDFNKSVITGTPTYSRSDFDQDNPMVPCTTPTNGMSTTTGSSNYYSSSNPDKAGVQAYVPDAQLYPFSQVEYTPDNTGRIRKQSGVGVDHKLGTDHETKYYYGQPEQAQLDRMFGAEVGEYKHYKKNMVQDANKQISVSYLDQQGRVIATSLAGEAPGNVNALASNNPGNELTIHYLKHGDATIPNGNRIENNSLIFSKELLVPTNTNQYEFYYDLEVPTYTDTCLLDPICYDCIYEMEISLTNECGENMFDPVSDIVGTVDTVCGTALTLTLGANALTPVTVDDLPVGNYTLSKKLTISQSALDVYTDNYLRNNECIKTYDEFLDSAMAHIDTTDCDISCAACSTKVVNYYALHNDPDKINPESEEYDPEYDFMSEEERDKAIDECTEPCEPINLCESQYQTLLSDVSPGGQYAKYEIDGSGNYSASDPLSIFNSSNMLPDRATPCSTSVYSYWRTPQRTIGVTAYARYYEEDGSESRITIVKGPDGNYYPAPLTTTCYAATIKTHTDGTEYIYPQELANLTDFINAFSSHPEWAKSLVEYHPEYAYYKWCIKNSNKNESKFAVSGTNYTSDSFDDLLRSINTAADAITAGFITGTPAADVLAKDPYFSGSATPNAGQGAPQSGVMGTLLGNYNSSSLTLDVVVAQTILCGTTYYGTCTAAFMGGTTDEKNKQWILYRNMYIAEKQKLQQQAANFYATHVYDNRYNGCIGIGSQPYNPWGGGPFSWISTDEPCGVSTWFYYKDKTKRFQNGSDIIPGVDPFGDAATAVNNLTNTTEYNTYLQTGQCPVTTDLGNMLDKFAQDNLLTTDFSLMSTPAFTKKLYDAVVAPTDPSTVLPQMEYYWESTETGTDLDVKFREGAVDGTPDACGEDGIGLHLSLPGSYDWDDVIRLYGIQFTTESPSGTYNFTIKAYIDTNPADLIPAIEVAVTGNTCIKLDGCSFPNNCGPNEMAINLQNLFNGLIAGGDMLTGDDIDVSPYDELFFDKLLLASGSSISDADWSWNNGSQTGTLSYTVGETTSTCTYLFDFEDGVVPYDMDDVDYFTNITPTSSNPTTSFTMDAWIGSSFITVTVTSTNCFNLKTCLPPPNISCTGPGYETNETFLAGLNNIAAQGKLLTDVGLTPLPYFADLFDVSPEPAEWNFLSVNNTTKVLHISIKNGSGVETCELSMTFDDTGNSHNFSDVAGFSTLEVPSIGDVGAFKVTAVFTDGTTQVINCSSDCIILKPCEQCTNTTSVANLVDMDFDAFNSSSPGFTTSRTYSPNFTGMSAYYGVNNYYTVRGPGYFVYSFPDHTNPGVGSYLLAASDETANVILWENTISGISPNTNYKFTYWVLRADAISPPSNPIWSGTDVQTSVDGALTNIPGPTVQGVWTEVSQIWFSGAASSVDLKIIFNAFVGIMGIDDISFEEVSIVPCIVTQADPSIVPILPYVNPCVENLKNIATANALASYNFYMDEIENTFRENYLEHCKHPIENLKMVYEDSEHHFTLYYYDQGGNLIRTVPPQGVVLVTDPADLAQVALDRAMGEQTYFTQHSYITKYEYNSLNQLLRQSVPDHELMNKWEMNGLGTLPSGYNIYGNAFSNDEAGFVVGDDGAGHGVIYLTTNGGDNWSPLSSLGIGNLQDIQMLVSDGYAITDQGNLVSTSNGGSTWSVISSTGIASKLNDLHFTSASTGMVIGDDGIILMTSNSGSTWSAPGSLPASVGTNNLNDLQYVSTGTPTWYIAGDNGTIIKSTDGGDNWTAITPAINSNIDLYALDFSNAAGYVAGVNSSSNKGVVMKYDVVILPSTYGWTTKLTAAFNETEFKAFNMNSSGIGYAGGTNGKMYKSTDYGNSWAAESITGFTGTANSITEMDFPSPTVGYATVSNGTLLALSGTWSSLSSPVNTSLNGLHFTGATDGFAVGDGGAIYDIDISGPTWTSLTNVNFSELYDACLVDDNSNLGYAVGNGGAIVTTSNGGSTWSSVTNSNTEDLNAVYFVTASNGKMVGNTGTILACNVTTVSSPETSGTSEHLRDITYTASEKWVTVGDNRTILVKPSGTWNTISSFTGGTGTDDLYSVYFVGGTGYICGSNGSVYKTLDDGATWSITGATSTTEILREVWFRDYLTGYVMGDNNTILKTIDGGASWIAETGPGGNYQTAHFSEEGHALIAGTGTNNLSELDDEANDHSSRFWYDRLGRMIVSQNSKQFGKSPKAYSYTKYDALGRITEVAETGTGTSIATIAGIHGVIGDDAAFATWLGAGTHTEVTSTLYDVVVSPSITGFTQGNLRKRVSSVNYASTEDNDASTFDHATHYSYDIHGNVKTLLQDNPALAAVTPSQQYKKIDYIYDLVSGKVNQVSYQNGEPDAFYHQYEYDADNRITNVITSKDGVIWDKDANYFYYQHGPLARTELGDQKVQAMDYAYTIQGWIKGVNSNTLKETRDIGLDGETGSTNLNRNFARDAFGYSLNYFADDYAPIGTISDDFIASTASNTGLATDAPNLYNGNIKSMITAINDLTTPSAPAVVPQLTAYKYDQLNRINRMKAYRDINLSTNTWGSGSSYDESYETTLDYDANGNILHLKRKGLDAIDNGNMDELTYNYENISGSYVRNTNKLRSVDDVAAGGNYNTDIDHQTANNYEYDELGNLVGDVQEQIDNIDWTVYGKIKSITRVGGSSKPNLEFLYDASGNRIAKIVKPQATLADPTTWITTNYVRDAQGNVMSTYELADVTYTLKEQMLYGSSRLGTFNRDLDLTSYTANDVVTRVLGKKNFELSNHLGNVLSVTSDRKLSHSSNTTTIDYYLADIQSATDYYSFGAAMPGRSFVGANGYRYGFNGKEKDDEVKGNGNSYDFDARIYDPRIGRWLSLDPLQTKYPGLSPYNFAENNPIFFADPDGKDAIGKIAGNTITISATIYLANNQSTKINVAEAQKSINQYWGKDFKYTDEKGKEYNVKFEITVKEVSPIASENTVDEGTNFVRPEAESFRSRVKGPGGWYGRWAANQKNKTYAHEVGHMLGLADQYVDVEYDAGNLDQNQLNGKRESWDYESTTPDEVMGTANKIKAGQEKVSQKDIDAIASFVLTNQQDGKAIINNKNLVKDKKSNGLAAPTLDDEIKMDEKVSKNNRSVVDPHSDK